jgi:hypothetical protein
MGRSLAPLQGFGPLDTQRVGNSSAPQVAARTLQPATRNGQLIARNFVTPSETITWPDLCAFLIA